ncbi:MAG: ABC transporter ATP-binding protein [Phycisphaerales bacterium]|nr:ABC transporter ATP-binding protein [Phycisphaerales bacterium]
MIEAKDLTKTYGSQRVLQGACLSIPPGQCVVLTGDNGSGKTTLLHMLVGLRHPDAGQVFWKGQPLAGASARQWQMARKTWGFLPQNVVFPSGTPVGRLMRFHARLRGTDMTPIQQWLDRVGLAGTEKKTVEALSGGMQQRLGIALTLFFSPQLIVMDEPASSLDPGWRGELSQWTSEQAQRGASILVTSQLHESWGDGVRYCDCQAGRIVDKARNQSPVMEKSA